MGSGLLDRVANLPDDRRLVLGRVLDVLERLEPEDAELVLSATAQAVDQLAGATPSEEAVTAATGEPAPSPERVVRARAATLTREFLRRRELVEGSLATREVAGLLGVSRQTPHDRVRAGRLLALRDRGELRFPAWQFDPERPDGVLQGLAEVLASMGPEASSVARATWLTEPKTEFDGRAPVEVLRSGDVAAVVAEAAALRAP